jgi:predicted RNase H-like nuclease (RuvC/YqgF family)
MNCPICNTPKFKVILDITGDYATCSNNYCELGGTPTYISDVINMLAELVEIRQDYIPYTVHDHVLEQLNDAGNIIDSQERTISDLEAGRDELEDRVHELEDIIYDLEKQIKDLIRSNDETD